MFVSSLFTAQLKENVTTHWVGALSLGSPRESLKNHQNSSLLPIPSKITKSVPKATKILENVIPNPPSGHQISE